MKKLNLLFSGLGLCFTALSPQVLVADSLKPAFGLSGTVIQKDAPSVAHPFLQVAPELVGYLYQPSSDQLWLRYGARLGYAWQQPEMPASVQFKEYDFRAGA